MNSLKKVFLFYKNIEKPWLIQELFVQIYVFSAITVFFGGMLGGDYICFPIGLLLVVHLYSFLRKKEKLLVICTILSILFSLWIFIMVVIVMLRGDWDTESLIMFFWGIFIVFCNSFFWHFHRGNGNQENTLFRVIILLGIGFLLFPIVSCFYWFLEAWNLFFLLAFECCTLLYIVWKISSSQIGDGKVCQGEDKESARKGSLFKQKYETIILNWKNEIRYFTLPQQCFVLFIIFYSFLVIGVFNDTTKRIGYHLAMPDMEKMPSMKGYVPVSVSVLLFCMVWAIAILVNNQGKGAKTGMVVSVIAGIPIFAYMFFKAVLLF